MKVLDKGEIKLLDSMGSDETIARAAWVSYAKQDDNEGKDIGKLINYLAKHRHGTPFEHVVYQFYVKAPLFVAREWFRHRIGSFNEVSGRYITFQPEFYYPEHFRVKGTSNKQGSVVPDKAWFDEHYPSGLIGTELWDAAANVNLTKAYGIAYDAYQGLLNHGVANELARMTMPLGLYTEWWWTVNLRSLLNFVSLRSETTAQWEIQEYSRAIEGILESGVPLAYQAFVDNGRIAP